MANMQSFSLAKIADVVSATKFGERIFLLDIRM